MKIINYKELKKIFKGNTLMKYANNIKQSDVFVDVQGTPTLLKTGIKSTVMCFTEKNTNIGICSSEMHKFFDNIDKNLLIAIKNAKNNS